jgi:SAM-dependent methyltransferase
VGTGRGETLAYADQAGHGPVQGTEVVPYLLGGRVSYAEAHAQPFADGQFDHVTCFDVLDHLTEPDIDPALREMYRVAGKTATVSASERSDIRNGRELHISKRPAAQWLELIGRCWPGARIIGTAGASPAFQVVKP